MARIGILEDSALMRRYLADLISQVGGHEAHAFEHPQDLWDAIEPQQLQLIVLDIGLGALAKLNGSTVDGIAVCQQLKASSPRLPVVLLTAHAFDADVDSFLTESGADAYETKPIRDEDAFLARVAGLVQE